MHLYSVEFHLFSTRDTLAAVAESCFIFIHNSGGRTRGAISGWAKKRNRAIPLGRFQPARSPSNLAGAVSGLSVIRPKTQKSGKSRDRTPFSKRIGDYALIEKA